MAIDAFNDQRGSLLQIVFPVGNDAAQRYEFDLDRREYGVVGYAIVHWSFLEHALLVATKRMAIELGLPLPIDATQNSLRKRLKAYRAVVAHIGDLELREKYEKIAARISTENGFRQKITHGIWSYNPADPDVLHVEISRTGDRPGEFLNGEKIEKFAIRVSEIAFQLLNPNGFSIDDLAAERANSPGFISRTFLRQIVDSN